MNRFNNRNPYDTNLNEVVSILEKVQPKKKINPTFENIRKRQNSRGKGQPG
jgi:hypothetical protein